LGAQHGPENERWSLTVELEHGPRYPQFRLRPTSRLHQRSDPGANELVLISTVMLLERALTTTMSGLRSLLKSPTATKLGLLLVPKFCAAWKVPSPLPSSTETVSEL